MMSILQWVIYIYILAHVRYLHFILGMETKPHSDITFTIMANQKGNQDTILKKRTCYSMNKKGKTMETTALNIIHKYRLHEQKCHIHI